MKIGSATTSDWQAILALLDRAALPIADLDGSHIAHFLAAHDGEVLAGTVAIEPFGSTGLLRSLIVDATFRREGLGRTLTQSAEIRARELGLTSLFLLTTTAAPFFDRSGYTRIDRSEAPSEVQRSAEFASLCPSSAVCMRKGLA
jgi:amino-acid N-acetyltransferase